MEIVPPVVGSLGFSFRSELTSHIRTSLLGGTEGGRKYPLLRNNSGPPSLLVEGVRLGKGSRR